ncbi:MAG: glycosyltransferase family 2 protein [Deltaproteobacteria bacterium]|nr:glycosyltransferase family 2 protein [Deltaproteobacteria bacterium]
MVSSSPPQVSVIIPTFNRGALTARAVASVLAQTRPPQEILVIDDGSSDDTGNLLNERFGDRIRYLRQANRGPGAARNRGVREARSELVAFLDSDDTWRPEKLEAQVPLLSGDDVVLCYGNWTDGQTSPGADYFSRIALLLPERRWMVDQPLALLTRGKGSGIWTTTCVCKKPAVERVGGFDEKYRVGEDLRLWFRLAFEGKFAVTSEVLAERAWLGPDRQLTDTKKEAYFREAAAVRTEIFLEAYGRAMQADPAVQRALRRLLADGLADLAKFAACDGKRGLARRRGFEALACFPRGKSALKALLALIYPGIWGWGTRKPSR